MGPRHHQKGANWPQQGPNTYEKKKRGKHKELGGRKVRGRAHPPPPPSPVPQKDKNYSSQIQTKNLESSNIAPTTRGKTNQHLCGTSIASIAPSIILCFIPTLSLLIEKDVDLVQF
jgi:hypothetical protein